MDLAESDHLTAAQKARIPAAIKESLEQTDPEGSLQALQAKVEATIQASRESQQL